MQNEARSAAKQNHQHPIPTKQSQHSAETGVDYTGDNEIRNDRGSTMIGFNQTTACALTAFAILAASAAPALPAPIASGKANFDGQWSVLIVTEKGTCDRAYRYPVRISGGSVGYAGEASFDVTGRVMPNGAVTVTVSKAGHSASGSGRLSGTDGSGHCRPARGECSGTWSAERRG
jgi:hypothetical protein